MNASKPSNRVQRRSQGRAGAPSSPVMQPVGTVLALAAGTNRSDNPWFWNDRWAD